MIEAHFTTPKKDEIYLDIHSVKMNIPIESAVKLKGLLTTLVEEKERLGFVKELQDKTEEAPKVQTFSNTLEKKK